MHKRVSLSWPITAAYYGVGTKSKNPRDRRNNQDLRDLDSDFVFFLSGIRDWDSGFLFRLLNLRLGFADMESYI